MKLKNHYFVLRHGEALSNTKNIISCWPEKANFPLTKKGIKQIEESVKKLKKENIDFIFSSDLLRTKQSAKIAGKILGITPLYNEKLREYNVGIFNGQPIEKLASFFSNNEERFTKKPLGGETYRDIGKRIISFLKEIEKKYSNKKILIISHQVVIIMLLGRVKGLSDKEIFEKYFSQNRIKNGEMIELKNH